MNDKEDHKAAREREIFKGFCETIGLKYESIESRRPPESDILCKIDGKSYFFELVEITDEGLAAGVSKSMKTGDITGGAYSQDRPLCRAFDVKAANTYATAGCPLVLLAYYDKQYPWNVGGYFDDLVGQKALNMVAAGIWHSIWIYDTWKKQLLWQHGQSF